MDIIDIIIKEDEREGKLPPSDLIKETLELIKEQEKWEKIMENAGFKNCKINISRKEKK